MAHPAAFAAHSAAAAGGACDAAGAGGGGAWNCGAGFGAARTTGGAVFTTGGGGRNHLRRRDICDHRRRGTGDHWRRRVEHLRRRGIGNHRGRRGAGDDWRRCMEHCAGGEFATRAAGYGRRLAATHAPSPVLAAYGMPGAAWSLSVPCSPRGARRRCRPVDGDGWRARAAEPGPAVSFAGTSHPAAFGAAPTSRVTMAGDRRPPLTAIRPAEASCGPAPWPSQAWPSLYRRRPDLPRRRRAQRWCCGERTRLTRRQPAGSAAPDCATPARPDDPSTAPPRRRSRRQPARHGTWVPVRRCAGSGMTAAGPTGAPPPASRRRWLAPVAGAAGRTPAAPARVAPDRPAGTGRHRPRGGHRARRHHRRGAAVDEVVDRDVAVDRREVGDMGDVDLPQVAVARAIPGAERLARPQRTTSRSGPAASAAPMPIPAAAPTPRKVTSAGRIDRPRRPPRRPGSSPSAPGLDPAAVVERRETPGLRCPPRSSPTVRHRPSGRRDTAPSPARPADTRPGHTPGSSTRSRTRPAPRRPASPPRWAAARRPAVGGGRSRVQHRGEERRHAAPDPTSPWNVSLPVIVAVWLGPTCSDRPEPDDLRRALDHRDRGRRLGVAGRDP